MQRKIMVLGAAAFATASLSACGDHSSSATSTPAPPITQELDSAAVLALAQKTSESSQPIAVDNNALVITDTSDTTEPISVSAM
jgi:protein-disulfide isomerase